MTEIDPLVGQTIAGKYRIESLIGRGGSGAVYRAEDTKGKRRVAIKVLPPETAQITEMAKRFKREATTGKRIVHPNVVAIFDQGQTADGGLFLAMELVDGRSLESLLRDGRLRPERALAIARQVLAGLGAAHVMGIAHRDVKPENVLLVDVAGVETVKLLDFGIASNDRAAEKLTAQGVAFGTPEYISPEMAVGLAVDSRADIYSLGVVLFQMVTGRLPFVKPDLKSMLQAHAYEAPPKPREVAPDAKIPEGVEKLILKAMEKLSQDRFATTAAMVEAIDGLAKGAPKRAGGMRWVALGVGFAVVAGIAVAGWAILREGPAAPTPEVPRVAPPVNPPAPVVAPAKAAPHKKKR